MATSQMNEVIQHLRRTVSACTDSRRRRCTCPTTPTPPMSTSALEGVRLRLAAGARAHGGNAGGRSLGDRHIPHRLVARNSCGEEVSILALIKTQGSDTKLVAQCNPSTKPRGSNRGRSRASTYRPSSRRSATARMAG